MTRRVLIARLDSAGDVLLAGPAVRAVAASGAKVTLLVGPIGAPAARLLPGVDAVVVAQAGWVEFDGPAVTRASVLELADRVAQQAADEAVVLTSYHQSPLPLAMVLRMAGVGRIGAISEDFPGTLLDVRHRVDDDIHEVERSLSLCAAMGFGLPATDPGGLEILAPPLDALPPELPPGPYVVVHPGSSAPARCWPAPRHAELVRSLSTRGWQVVVTGSTGEKDLTALVAGRSAVDLGGRLELGELAAVIAAASVVVVANTGPAHLAAAVGTPVVSLFAPTVPACRWRPWRVPHLLLGDQLIACAGCRARRCPVTGHPCLAGVHTPEVIDAVERLAAPGAGTRRP